MSGTDLWKSPAEQVYRSLSDTEQSKTWAAKVYGKVRQLSDTDLLKLKANRFTVKKSPAFQMSRALMRNKVKESLANTDFLETPGPGVADVEKLTKGSHEAGGTI